MLLFNEDGVELASLLATSAADAFVFHDEMRGLLCTDDSACRAFLRANRTSRAFIAAIPQVL